jgi:hypothetical protein
MSQTTITDDPIVAVPGMLADFRESFVTSYIANEAIEAGKFVRVRADGKIEVPTDDTGSLVGIVLYNDTKESSYPQGSANYVAGDVVPVVRYGAVYAQFVTGSGAQAPLGAAQLSNGATVADRGKITSAVAAANSVRTLAGRVLYIRPVTAPTNLCLVEVSLP